MGNTNRFKPLFKKLLRLRENLLNKTKVLKFKKIKWKQFLEFYKRKLKNFKKYKPIDHSLNKVTRYGTKGNSYKKRYRNSLQLNKRIRLYYGNIGKKKFKKMAANNFTKENLLNYLESRLEIILYKAKFSPSIKAAKQLISHGKVFVNNTKVTYGSFIIKPGDEISLHDSVREWFEQNLVDSSKWPIPPKNLAINYKTMQIIFIKKINNTNIANYLPFYFNTQSVLQNLNKK